MPVLPGNQSTSPTLQAIANQLRSNPAFYNLLGGAAGSSEEPMLMLSNEIMSRILAENMPWKWNRSIIPPFLTVSLQQDYCTQVTNIGWLENGWLVDINNSTSNANGAPKPVRPLETVRDLPQTSVQSVPFQVSFVPNYQAFMGLWQANTAYSFGYGVPMFPRSHIKQFMDVNGNILYIDSTNLGLNIESPGFTGTTIALPTPNPYGVSGSTQPAAPPNATPGSQVADGTVTWTVADPEGFAIRTNPVAALNGLEWWVYIQQQVRPPRLFNLKQSIAPIPWELSYLFRAGLRAALYRENNDPRGQEMYAEWEEQTVKALRAADRQQEENVFYPTSTCMGGPMEPFGWAGIGAANPYGPTLFSPGYGS